MHLTNYAINKHSDEYVAPTGADDPNASKRSTKWLLSHLAAEGHDAEAIWAEIGDVCVKTLVPIAPSLAHV